MEKRRREHAMKIHLPSAVESALSLLTSQGFAAYAVGGCVRDSLLGKEPHDWDITTAARPEDMLAIFEGFPLVPTGLKHGTLTVHIDGMPIEITTFRVDGGYSDHRHPDAVRFSPHLADDLSRRDFTVNAMAYHPQTGLVDFFGGREDLRLGLILSLIHICFDFRGLIFAEIIIGALGAVMDVSMDIASALEELISKVPELGFRQIIKSGMKVGRDVMGTMANTLILAYAGGSLSTIMLITVSGKDLSLILNGELISVEILKAMAGSIGILFTIPITAIVTALLHTCLLYTSVLI